MTLLKLMRSSKASYYLALGCLLAAFSLTGCLNDDGNPGPAQLSYVSIYHASPDADDLDILAGNYAVNNEPFAYGDYTNYISLHPGDRKFKFTESGKSDNVLVDTTFTIENLKNYTIFIADSLSRIGALVLTDSAESPGTGKAMIRFVHLSPDTPEVRVMADDEELFAEQSFKGGTAFQEIAAGTITFDFRSTDGGEILLMTPGTELKAGKFYTMILKGFSNPPAGNSNELSTDIYRN
jgi:hypothetical protein